MKIFDLLHILWLAEQEYNDTDAFGINKTHGSSWVSFSFFCFEIVNGLYDIDDVSSVFDSVQNGLHRLISHG